MRSEPALRPIDDEDLPLVFSVFAEVRRELFAGAGLAEAQLEQLLQLQFQVQQTQFRRQYPHAHYDLIVADGVDVGYLYVDRGEEAFTLVDVALMQRSRGAGLGGYLARQLLDEAAVLDKPVRAHVEKTNRAWNLWRRLGFRVVGDDGVYLELECPPGGWCDAP